MGIIEDKEVFKNFTKNDLFEYRQVCKKIGEHAKMYEKKINKLKLSNEFHIDYIFNTSHSAKFYNIEVKFLVKKRFRKSKVFFNIIKIVEISQDDFLDIIDEIKK